MWLDRPIHTISGEVRELLEQFVRVQLYTDGQGPMYEKNRAFQEARFGTVALPFYAITSPNDEEIAHFPGMTRDAKAFIRFLNRGLASVSPAVTDVTPGW